MDERPTELPGEAKEGGDAERPEAGSAPMAGGAGEGSEGGGIEGASKACNRRRPRAPRPLRATAAPATGRTLYGVAVTNETARKPYLGGYRHKLSGSVFHNAATQTPREPRRDWEGKPPKFHRDTQTVVQKTRSQQSKRESGTQMQRRDLYLDDRLDREVAPRPYFSAAQLDELKLRKTVVIQCYWRGFMARKRVRGMWEALNAKREQVRAAEEKQREEEEAKRQREFERRMRPVRGPPPCPSPALRYRSLSPSSPAAHVRGL